MGKEKESIWNKITPDFLKKSQETPKPTATPPPIDPDSAKILKDAFRKQL